MKAILISVSLLAVCTLGNAQDYYAITTESNNTTFNYPPNVDITLINPDGTSTRIEGEMYMELLGDYRLEIAAPWSKKKEIIESNGMLLTIKSNVASGFVQEDVMVYQGRKYDRAELELAMSNKPKLVEKSISKSEGVAGKYNLAATFSNKLTFTYADGKVSAMQYGKAVEIKGMYCMDTPEGPLKLSFDPGDGEFWYVFDITNAKY